MKITKELSASFKLFINGLKPEKELLPYILTFGIITIILHFYQLGVRPFHHDESLHAYYAYKIIKDYGYRYNPMMHGPFLFFSNALIYLIFGTSNFTARLLPALLGSLLVISPLFIKRFSKPVKIFISLLFLISSTLTYYGRFIRNDIYIVFFGFLVMYFVSRIIETHDKRYWYLAVFFWTLIFTSKENSYIIAFIIFLYIFYEGIVREKIRAKEVLLHYGLEEDLFVRLFVVFFVIYALLYTSFFVYPKGIFGMGYALKYWWIQHKKQRLGGPPTYYLPLIALYEPIIIYTIVVGAASAWKNVRKLYQERPLFRLSVWWAVLSLLIYAYAGEKAPWIVVHMVFPLIIVAGFIFGSVWERYKNIGKIIFLIPIFILGIYGVYANYLVNFRYPTIEPVEGKHAEILIYVQSTKDVTKVSKILHSLAKEHKDLKIEIHPDYTWPFPWYLRDLSVAYDKRVEKYLNYDVLITNDVNYPKVLESTHNFIDGNLRAWWIPQGNFWWLLKKENRGKLIRYIFTREVWSPIGGYRMRIWIKKGLKWED